VDCVKRYCGVPGRLQDVSLSAVCWGCGCGGLGVCVFMLDTADNLELVDKFGFCYLGDMLGKGGGTEEASKTRIWCVWANSMSLVT